MAVWLQAKVRKCGFMVQSRLCAGSGCDAQRRCSCGVRLVALC